MGGKQFYKRLTLVRVEEEWQDQENDPSTMRLLPGDRLQLSTVRPDGWAYGWSLEKPSRRGWFPASLITQRLEPSLASLQKEPEFLSASASEALVSLLKTVPLPPAQSETNVAIPALVKESARKLLAEYNEQLEKFDAQQAQWAAQVEAPEESTVAHCIGGSEDISNLFAEQPPDDSHPLMVCKVAFWVGTKNESLLLLEVGDLVRVTSLLNSEMLFGFFDGKSEKRGWFPSKCVRLLEEDAGIIADIAAVDTPPPLPQVPQCLRGRLGR